MSSSFFCGDFLPFLLIQEEEIVSYLGKNWHLMILVNCLREACIGTVVK